MLPYIIIAICIILLAACYTDMRYRIINHSTVIPIFFLSLLMGYLADNENLEINIYAPLIFLAVGICFMKYMGAGDMKLLTALTVGLSTESVFKLILLTSMAGFVVAIIAFLVHHLKRRIRARRIRQVRGLSTIQMMKKWKMKVPKAEVPYGVAISIGYWLMHMSF